MTAIYLHWDTVSIRRYLREKQERLFKVIQEEGVFRLSSVCHHAHTHAVSIDMVDEDDLAVQARRYLKAADTLRRLGDEMMEAAFEIKDRTTIKSPQALEVKRTINEIIGRTLQ